MAIESVCGIILNGIDTDCTPPVRRYVQQAVVMNISDIDTKTLTLPDGVTCEYKINFALKSGKTGVLFISPEAGSSVKGFVDKAVSDLGHPTFIHHAQFLVGGATASVKCVLDALTKGRFMVAFQLMDNTIEIYGSEKGLVSADFTYDLQEGGGGVAILLDSLEVAPENNLPLVYESAIPGNEVADFDSLFAQP